MANITPPVNVSPNEENKYVTDPELLNQLNSVEPTKSDASQYVTDPELLQQLNSPAEKFEGTAQKSGDTSIADVIKNYGVKPIADLFTKYDESAKHPYLTSAATGIINAQNVVTSNNLANLIELMEADKKTFGPNFEKANPEQLQLINERKQAIQDNLNTIAQRAEDVNAIEEKYVKEVPTLSKKLDVLENTPKYQDASKFQQLKMYGKELVKNASDIPEYMAHVSLESLPTSMAQMVTGALTFATTGNLRASAMAAGYTSAFTEFGQQYVQLRQQGLDHEEATKQAGIKSGVIGFFDSKSFGSAGEIVDKVMKHAEKGIAKRIAGTAKEVTKEIGKQAAFGASGEFLGSVASGQPVSVRGVAEEAIGEIAGAPGEALATYRSKTKEAQQEKAAQELQDKLATESSEQPQPTPETPTPPTPPRVVTQDALLSHATTRLKELEEKATGTPDIEGMDSQGNPRTFKGREPQLLTDQEKSEREFLQTHIGNPEKLADGYGVAIGETKVTGSQDTEGMLGELEGKEIQTPPIYQIPAETKPAEPEVPATPETTSTPEVPPVEDAPPAVEEEDKPPTVVTEPTKIEPIGKAIDNTGKEHPLPTIADAEKSGAEYSPINRDKPMYVKTDIDGIFTMIGKLFGDNTHPYISPGTTKVTSDKNATLPTNKNVNQVSVVFRPDTLSGRQISDNEFISYDTAHKAIESFTIHNPARRLQAKTVDSIRGIRYLDKFFSRGDNPDGSITYTLKRVKSKEEKAAENERISKEYIEHINRPRGKLTYKYKRLRKPGLNDIQQVLNKYDTLGGGLKEVLERLEKAIADNQYETSRALLNDTGSVEVYNGTDPFLKGTYKHQAEMYVDIIKHLMKIDPVMKTHLYMDPYVVGSTSSTVPGFYNRVSTTLALFANTDLTTFIHEAIHAATVHYIDTHPNDPKVNKLKKIMTASRSKDQKIRGSWKLYGNTNLKEFIAETFSNPEFIKHLKKIDPIFDKSEATSIFDNLKTIVSNMMKAMGINTDKDRSAFDEVMDLSSDLFIGKTLEGYKYDLGHPLDAKSAKKQIESEPFKKWFGKSKVVNPDGTPRVMYHGTRSDISEFKSAYQLAREKDPKYGWGLAGIYFTPDPSFANMYAQPNFRKRKEQANVLPVYLKMENPYRYPSNLWAKIKGAFLNPIDKAQVAKAVEKNRREKGFADYDNIPSMELSAEGYRGIVIQHVKKLKAQGYDGVISPDGQMYIVFDANQIKSAIGNKGTYNLDSGIITENQQPLNEQQAQEEEQSRQIFNYRGDPVDIRKWEIPEQGPIAARLSKWFQEYADEHVMISKVQNAIKALNRTISDMSDADKKQELKNSRISSQLLQFANEEVNPILKDMLEKGVSIEEINKFMLAKHAKYFNDRMNEINHKVDENGNLIPYKLKDRASSMSTQDAANYLNGLTPERKSVLESITKKWYDIRDKTQRILIESGQETQQTIDLWNEIYPFYVPLNREQEQQAMPAGMRTGVGIDTRGNFAKRAMGSEKQVSSIVDALLYQRERAVSRAENNEVGKSVYRLFLENPNPDFAISVNPDAIHSRAKLIEELRDMGYENPEGIVDNIMAEPKERYLRKVKLTDFVIDPTTGLPIPNSKEVVDERISRNARFGDNVLTFKVDGKERYVFFNKKDPNAMTMIRALKNLDAQTMGGYLRLNRTINHYFSQLYTVLNPIFSIKNGFRDLVFGQAALSTTPIRGKQIEVDKKVFPAMIGIMSVLRKERASDGSATSRWQKIYKEALDAGFQTSNRYGVLNIGEEDSYIQQTLNSYKDGNTKKALKYIINMTRDFASMIENGMRLAAYQQMRETIDPETSQPYSPQKSASVAKNLTINFDKKGSKSGPLRAQFMFFNATIRGDVRLLEVLKGPAAQKIIAGGILVGVIQAMMMAAAGFKDDDPPEYIKERNIIVPTGDGKYITLPLLPYGLNILPNFGRLVTEYGLEVAKHSEKSLAEGFAKAHAGKKAFQFANAFFGSFSPFGNQGLSLQGIVPSMYEIPGSLFMNKNSFGQTISKQDSYKRPTPGYMRTKESGSSFGKEIAKWLNILFGGTEYKKGAWSPTGDDIDFIASSLTGPVVGSVSKTVKYGKAKMEGEEVPAYQVPIAGNFMGEIDSKPVITSRFYNNLHDMYEHELTLKNIRHNLEEKRKYLSDNPEARMWRRAESIDAQINNINAMKKKAEMMGRPKEQIQRLDNKKLIKMNQFNDMVEKLKNQ
jgi:hypothetical protein